MFAFVPGRARACVPEKVQPSHARINDAEGFSIAIAPSF
jgi:hypothetical protein